jgi:hypothetical protein
MNTIYERWFDTDGFWDIGDMKLCKHGRFTERSHRILGNLMDTSPSESPWRGGEAYSINEWKPRIHGAPLTSQAGPSHWDVCSCWRDLVLMISLLETLWMKFMPTSHPIYTFTKPLIPNHATRLHQKALSFMPATPWATKAAIPWPQHLVSLVDLKPPL